MNKESVVSEFKLHDKDTGSVEVQVVRLTQEIQHLTDHFKSFPKDVGSKRGLMRKIGQRNRFLHYLEKKNPEVYKQLLARLNIRG